MTAGVVRAMTNMQTVGSPIGGTHPWTCNASGTCQTDATGMYHQFWVDPAKPTASMKGAHGERYAIVGTGPYTIAGRTWKATTMNYRNGATGTELLCIFETETGMVLAYAETSPSQQVHTYFRSIRK